MADYCLDSNVVSDILRKEPTVMKYLNEALDNDIYIAAISTVNNCTLVINFVNWRF